MKSSCIEGCLDIVERPGPGLTNGGRLDKLHRWAEEDKEFLRNMVVRNKKQSPAAERSELQLLYYPSPEIIVPIASPGRDYACRQRYLRSYTFEKQKQNAAAAQRTKKYLINKNSTTKSCNSFVRAVFAVLFMCMVKVDVHN